MNDPNKLTSYETTKNIYLTLANNGSKFVQTIRTNTQLKKLFSCPQGAQKLKGEKLKLVWAEFSTLS
jgi:hypothetical protein